MVRIQVCWPTKGVCQDTIKDRGQEGGTEAPAQIGGRLQQLGGRPAGARAHDPGIADEYLAGYKLRNPRSATFAEYAIGHVKRLLGDKMLVDVREDTVKEYQDARLREKTAPRSINEELGFLLRMMGVAGDMFRVRLRKQKFLKLKTRSGVGKGIRAR